MQLLRLSKTERLENGRVSPNILQTLQLVLREAVRHRRRRAQPHPPQVLALAAAARSMYLRDDRRARRLKRRVRRRAAVGHGEADLRLELSLNAQIRCRMASQE